MTNQPAQQSEPQPRMIQQVAECPYCRGTFPHQAPTGCPPIQWPPEPRESVDSLNRFGQPE